MAAAPDIDEDVHGEDAIIDRKALEAIKARAMAKYDLDDLEDEENQEEEHYEDDYEVEEDILEDTGTKHCLHVSTFDFSGLPSPRDGNLEDTSTMGDGEAGDGEGEDLAAHSGEIDYTDLGQTHDGEVDWPLPPGEQTMDLDKQVDEGEDYGDASFDDYSKTADDGEITLRSSMEFSAAQAALNEASSTSDDALGMRKPPRAPPKQVTPLQVEDDLEEATDDVDDPHSPTLGTSKNSAQVEFSSEPVPEAKSPGKNTPGGVTRTVRPGSHGSARGARPSSRQ
mmetsp:Transcript_23727/g.28626  ORF Transcript_23727/g.28626 Transcript_23727/m.28626 type:complete len:282 (+) Transcript_23727:44-889(+)|eukprot:CAMPEP_0197846474 /NCGR_PEP_ID=MMETSP1438-20131217/3210_1 /TAXON_ID=1461541 /ORGANISM="Pterosperma sp., Strain CCMP1384" /LENGTH=281 /DNA_ID=CAMNT_0043458141 /DNA_START=39 /DNA_END=884 /DNA_ORIENTATION=-